MVMEINDESVLVVLVYRIPGPLGTFINDLIQTVSELPTQHRILIMGDFNLDQMLPENVTKLGPLIEYFNLYQRVNFSTNIYGGILDFVCNNTNPQPISWIPSAYSDHFVILFQI